MVPELLRDARTEGEPTSVLNKAAPHQEWRRGFFSLPVFSIAGPSELVHTYKRNDRLNNETSFALPNGAADGV